MFTIRSDDFNAFAAQLAGSADAISDLAYSAMVRVGRNAVVFMSTYPARFSGRGPGFVSDKQRRYFFAALRAGRIQVPYQRSGILGRAWHLEARGKERLEVTNTTRYAPYVQLRPTQARIHQGRWQTVEDVEPRLVEWGSQSLDVMADEYLTRLNANR